MATLLGLNRFDDERREFVGHHVNPAAVAAVSQVKELWGKDGKQHAVRQVWMIGGAWFHLDDQDGELLKLLKL